MMPPPPQPVQSVIKSSAAPSGAHRSRLFGSESGRVWATTASTISRVSSSNTAGETEPGGRRRLADGAIERAVVVTRTVTGVAPDPASVTELGVSEQVAVLPCR